MEVPTQRSCGSRPDAEGTSVPSRPSAISGWGTVNLKAGALHPPWNPAVGATLEPLSALPFQCLQDLSRSRGQADLSKVVIRDHARALAQKLPDQRHSIRPTGWVVWVSSPSVAWGGGAHRAVIRCLCVRPLVCTGISNSWKSPLAESFLDLVTEGSGSEVAGNRSGAVVSSSKLKGSSLISISERYDPVVGSSVATVAQAASRSFLRFSSVMIKCHHRSIQKSRSVPPKQIAATRNLRTLSSFICSTQGLEIWWKIPFKLSQEAKTMPV